MTIEKLLKILENIHAPAAEIFFFDYNNDEPVAIDSLTIHVDENGLAQRVILR